MPPRLGVLVLRVTWNVAPSVWLSPLGAGAVFLWPLRGRLAPGGMTEGMGRESVHCPCVTRD